jgi:hypothetical protein
MPTTPRPIVSRKRRIVFGLVTAVAVWLIVDTGLYFFLDWISTRYGIFYGLRTPTDEEISAFTEIGFHPDFGWDLRKTVKRGPLGEKKGHDYTLKPRYKAKAFGDSFVEGVRDPTNAFEYYVEELTGWECLNFGVSGYGPDQGTLKYQANTVSTDYAILGMLDENIGRVVNRLRGFYTLEESYRTKPRYAVGKTGEMALLPNPIRDPRDLQKLKDPAYVDELRRDDYWSKYYEGLNAPYELRWPATSVLVPHANFFALQGFRLAKHAISPTYESSLWRSRHYHLYDEQSEGIAVLKHVVDEFVAAARAKGETPIILVFAAAETMEIMTDFHRKPYQPLVDHLSRTGVEFLDIGETFLKDGNFKRYYINGDGHLNQVGNRRVAEQIVEKIRALDGRAGGDAAQTGA